MVLRTPGLGVLTDAATRLEVWGDPIAHSRSPQLHAAAYALLGLEWTYGRRRVDESSFDAELTGLDTAWRGLSLTMPLKGAAFRAAISHDRAAALTGAVNTLLLSPEGPRGFNTDAGGIVRALADDAVTALPRARVVGAGATATSALVALGELGAREVEVIARRPEAVAPLHDLGARLGVRIVAGTFEASGYDDVPVTIATLPGDARLPDAAGAALARAGGLLLDVVYGHWPTALSAHWEGRGGRARSGLGMLLYQALLQIRIFRNGDPGATLPNERALVEAMRTALEEPRPA
ncbi:shikimate dehydrogenase [Microbacterium sp. HD4P20]|uniref:shikimate dehydrogenase n=1 Tax=Microbacterium sp. HD4P20 TaxID=2864874 RepID=UPI001C63CBDB|nr:shikimate dehydrogenase [Microbacterium sp. HD4P20]MCP2636919.1 shikimate dehydrogenase [Microbacterium sp. HD4P20]